MSATIIQGSRRPRSMPCLTPSAPQRHASTGSSRLTTNSQLSRSSSWTSTNSSISISPSTLRALQQAASPITEGRFEHELSWYRNLEDWDFENEMVKIGPPLSRQQQKHDSIQDEAAEQTTRAEAEEAERAARAARKEDESVKAILAHLLEQAGCTGLPIRVTEPVPVSFLSAEIRDLQQIVSQHRKHGVSVPAAKVSRDLKQVQSLILLVDNRTGLGRAHENESGYSLLRTATHELIYDFERLIDPHRTCVVCGCRNKVDVYPSKITSRCVHETNTCSPCIRMWVESQITAKGLKIKCVECPELFAYKDVQESVTKEAFEKYDILSARAAMTAIEDFRWCLNPSCTGGQEHLSGARFECNSCKHQYCVKHGTAWHQNETCDQYDTRWIAARIQDQASEEWKAVQAKKCPKCGALIEKDGGCDHMGCTAPGCNHQFNWSGAEQYEAQDPMPPPMSTKASVAMPANAQGGRRFRISRVFRLMLFRGREVEDIC